MLIIDLLSNGPRQVQRRTGDLSATATVSRSYPSYSADVGVVGRCVPHERVRLMKKRDSFALISKLVGEFER